MLLVMLLNQDEARALIEVLRGLHAAAEERGDQEPAEHDPDEWQLDLDAHIDLTDLLGPGFEAVATGDAIVLQTQLFPPGTSASDALWLARGFAVAGMHHALERYLKEASGREIRGNLVERNLIPWLGDRIPPISVSSDLYVALQDLDATRHLFIHNAGIVTEEYVRRVPECKLRIGERRPLTARKALDFASAVRRAGDLIWRAEQRSASAS